MSMPGGSWHILGVPPVRDEAHHPSVVRICSVGGNDAQGCNAGGAGRICVPCYTNIPHHFLLARVGKVSSLEMTWSWFLCSWSHLRLLQYFH